MRRAATIGRAGLFSDYRALVRSRSFGLPLNASECFDNDNALGHLAAQVQGLSQFVTAGSLSCEAVVQRAGSCTLVEALLPLEYAHFFALYCPHSCPAGCTSASVLSRPFFNKVLIAWRTQEGPTGTNSALAPIAGRR